MSSWDKKRAKYWEKRARELEDDLADTYTGFGCFIVVLIIIGVIAFGLK